MPQEFEAKVLDIDIKGIEEKLLKLGAKKEPEIFMKRWVFDIDTPKDEWIRLRSDGKKTTIAYKCKKGSGISETEEIEVKVDGFEEMAKILSKLKFKGKYYQENKRIVFRLKDIEFTIDFWPNIPPYLEIESSSEEKVNQGLRMLGLEGKDVGNLSTIKIFAKYGVDLHSLKEVRF